MQIIYGLFIYLKAFLTFCIIGPIITLLLFIYPSVMYNTIVPFCKLMIYMFGCSIKIRGNFPKDENFVIMANHSSFLDVFAIPCAFKGKFSAVAASKNFKIPIYATILKRMKVVSINRTDKDNAIKGITQAEQVLQSGYHIVILPEGTRTENGQLLPFKKGGFHLSKNTGANILPVITQGLFNIKPKNRWTIKPGKIAIDILEPIQVQDKTVDELLEETQIIFHNHFKSSASNL